MSFFSQKISPVLLTSPETVHVQVVSSEVTLVFLSFISSLLTPAGTIALCYQDARGHESDMNLRPDDQ